MLPVPHIPSLSWFPAPCVSCVPRAASPKPHECDIAPVADRCDGTFTGLLHAGLQCGLGPAGGRGGRLVLTSPEMAPSIAFIHCRTMWCRAAVAHRPPGRSGIDAARAAGYGRTNQ